MTLWTESGLLECVYYTIVVDDEGDDHESRAGDAILKRGIDPYSAIPVSPYSATYIQSSS